MRAEDGKLQAEMREDVDNRAVDALPVAIDRRVGFRPGGVVRCGAGLPGRAGYLGHAAEKSIVLASTEKDGAVTTHGNEDGAGPCRAFRLRRLGREQLLAAF